MSKHINSGTAHATIGHSGWSLQSMDPQCSTISSFGAFWFTRPSWPWYYLITRVFHLICDQLTLVICCFFWGGMKNLPSCYIIRIIKSHTRIPFELTSIMQCHTCRGVDASHHLRCWRFPKTHSQKYHHFFPSTQLHSDSPSWPWLFTGVFPVVFPAVSGLEGFSKKRSIHVHFEPSVVGRIFLGGFLPETGEAGAYQLCRRGSRKLGIMVV